ncbi:hypothetical protein M3564_10365 [Staphylococcus warneri]|uniref:hypothetical protein n=1 Tax=Staphylococcus warneri TaxID=1292 RepID=UPI00203AB8DC|nr:hypothetical protein [Staphylococcus warneri]MCM3104725.1 hypothetical protein [Staphylococcus warneri]
MVKCLTSDEIMEKIKANNGVHVDDDRHLDIKSRKLYKIKVTSDNNDIVEIKVESEKYVNNDMWGIEIKPTNENEFPQIYAHFSNYKDLEYVLTSIGAL